jgi:hypothetical protein
MGRRQRRRERGEKQPVSTTDYVDDEGNVLTLRDRVSDATLRALQGDPSGATLRGEREGRTAAASTEDLWARRGEFLFERLAVSWTIAGLPLTKQKELLGRYRMASSAERDWVRARIEEHLGRLGARR